MQRTLESETVVDGVMHTYSARLSYRRVLRLGARNIEWGCRRPPPRLTLLLAGYVVDHQVATAMAEASYDALVGPNAFSKTAGGSLN